MIPTYKVTLNVTVWLKLAKNSLKLLQPTWRLKIKIKLLFSTTIFEILLTKRPTEKRMKFDKYFATEYSTTAQLFFSNIIYFINIQMKRNRIDVRTKLNISFCFNAADL